jgi:oxygen-independent coproporphyrinogen-3 oxidase
MLGLYLHIPFCSSICNYCNFNRGLFDGALKDRYVEALEREILLTGRGEPADTIYFGGGTPSLLEPAEIRRLIEACRCVFDVTPDAEIPRPRASRGSKDFARRASIASASVSNRSRTRNWPAWAGSIRPSGRSRPSGKRVPPASTTSVST